MKLYLQFLCAAGYLKHSNDTTKLNIHIYINIQIIIEIHINRLSTTMQIFIPMDYSIMMSEKYFHFRKDKSIWQRLFFPQRKCNWIHDLWKYFSNYVFLRFLKGMYKNLKEIGINQVVSKLTIFVNI